MNSIEIANFLVNLDKTTREWLLNTPDSIYIINNIIKAYPNVSKRKKALSEVMNHDKNFLQFYIEICKIPDEQFLGFCKKLEKNITSINNIS